MLFPLSEVVRKELSKQIYLIYYFFINTNKESCFFRPDSTSTFSARLRLQRRPYNFKGGKEYITKRRKEINRLPHLTNLNAKGAEALSYFKVFFVFG